MEDTAFVSAPTETGPALTGTVTFNVFGPNDATCSGPVVFTSTNPITEEVSPGLAVVDSSSFTFTQAGVYRWIASSSGDATATRSLHRAMRRGVDLHL